MRNSKTKNRIALLIILLLGIGVGYALLSQDLTINGITKVKGNNWDIHFNNVQVSSGSVALSTGDSAASIDLNDNTLVNYTVTLNQPGDFYEFTVDAVNAGTVDGMIGEIISKLNGVVISSTNPLPSYLDYSVTYSSGVPIENNHLLAAGDTETYKVRVEFKRDIENSKLPTTDQNNTFSFGVSYLQKNGSAIVVPEFLPVYSANIHSPAHIDSVDLYIGQEYPNTVSKFSTFDEARAALKARSTVSSNNDYEVHLALKHRVINNIITDTYLEFIITQDMLESQTGGTLGTYTLKSTMIYDENGDCLPEYYDSDSGKCISPNYEENKAILQTAFGSNNCSEQTNYQQNYNNYRCMINYTSNYTMYYDIKVEENGGIIGDDYGLVCSYYPKDRYSNCYDPIYTG